MLNPKGLKLWDAETRFYIGKEVGVMLNRFLEEWKQMVNDKIQRSKLWHKDLVQGWS